MTERIRPRLGFLGLGWIGRHRLAAIADSAAADIVTIADPDPAALDLAQAKAPAATRAASLDEILDCRPDGVVIATPSAAHAEQCIAALNRGVAVFCQKPLARSSAEADRVIAAAREADRLLGVDFCYRETSALRAVHDRVRGGDLGTIYAVTLLFHNAYGPDKPWFYDARQSGGGCLIDLGSHLVDFLHWTFDEPVAVRSVVRFSGGRPLPPAASAVEDYAAAELTFASGAHVHLACSWRLSAGCDARIEIAAYGTRGGVAFRNVDGSFYDFVSEYYEGTRSEILSAPPDRWGGRAAVAWVERLATSPRFDPAAVRLVDVSRTLDRLYEREARVQAAHV